MTPRTEALLITKGHAFRREPFFRMIEKLGKASGIHWTHVEQPAAQSVLTPRGVEGYDAIVFYDMPGVRFATGDAPLELFAPSEEHKRDVLELTRAGKGLVFLHHAADGWPTWPEFAELIGARFHFQPGTLRGKAYPGSGYRFDTAQKISSGTGPKCTNTSFISGSCRMRFAGPPRPKPRIGCRARRVAFRQTSMWPTIWPEEEK